LRPIDRSSAGSFFDGRLEFARTEDGIALWNLAQQHQEKLNLQTVIDVSAYGNRTFSGEAQINEAYTYAFMSAYTAKLQGKEPAARRLDGARGKKDSNR
jgi:hypothetical protein